MLLLLQMELKQEWGLKFLYGYLDSCIRVVLKKNALSVKVDDPPKIEGRYTDTLLYYVIKSLLP